MRYSEHKHLYRSRRGVIWGVCQGLADWLEVPVGVLRLICLVAFVLSGFFPIAAIYALAALLLPLEPAGYSSRYTDREYSWEHRFYRN